MAEIGANLTLVSEFLLLGLSEDPKQQQLLFILFLSMYLVTQLGNLSIILAIANDVRLHTPMYFFLANLAFVDICFTSTTIPKMLANCSTSPPNATTDPSPSSEFSSIRTTVSGIPFASKSWI